jgi:hypothetical protein
MDGRESVVDVQLRASVGQVLAIEVDIPRIFLHAERPAIGGVGVHRHLSSRRCHIRRSAQSDSRSGRAPKIATIAPVSLEF